MLGGWLGIVWLVGLRYSGRRVAGVVWRGVAWRRMALLSQLADSLPQALAGKECVTVAGFGSWPDSFTLLALHYLLRFLLLCGTRTCDMFHSRGIEVLQ